MTTTPDPDDEPEHAPKAAVDWGDDCPPRIESLLEWTHTRCYNGWHQSGRIRALSVEEFRALAPLRLDAHAYLDVDEHAELRALEREIRRINDGRGPAGIENTHELDAAWCELLASHVEEYIGQPDAADGGDQG